MVCSSNSSGSSSGGISGSGRSSCSSGGSSGSSSGGSSSSSSGRSSRSSGGSSSGSSSGGSSRRIGSGGSSGGGNSKVLTNSVRYLFPPPSVAASPSSPAEPYKIDKLVRIFCAMIIFSCPSAVTLSLKIDTLINDGLSANRVGGV